jgi:hypothetical protein
VLLGGCRSGLSEKWSEHESLSSSVYSPGNHHTAWAGFFLWPERYLSPESYMTVLRAQLLLNSLNAGYTFLLSPIMSSWGRIDRLGDREVILFLINITRARLRQWNQETKTENPERLAPSHLLLDVKLEKQGDLKGLSASFLFEMLTSYKAPGMGRRKDCQREVLKHTYCPCILGRPGWHLPFLKTQLSHPDPLS